MAEHRARYESLGASLADTGYYVCAYDQRGHGDTAPLASHRRHISPGNDWSLLVRDARDVLGRVSREAAALAGTSVPTFVLGHSMGSLVVRDTLALLAREGHAEDSSASVTGSVPRRRGAASSSVPCGAVPCGAILMGTAGPGGVKVAAGKVIAGMIAALRSPSAPSKLLDDLTFGSYSAAFEPTRTAFDWLSRDEAEVERYIDDPRCGEVMSAHFFRELARGTMRVSSENVFASTPHATALLLVSGTEDPVGDHGTGVRAVAERYRRAGHPSVGLHFFEGARHELLHETNRKEVIEYVIRWIEDRSASCKELEHIQR
jgi:alpha-beta hydrolase superfamily lysophospholipase